MHGGTLEANRVRWQSVNTESSQERFGYRGKHSKSNITGKVNNMTCAAFKCSLDSSNSETPQHQVRRTEGLTFGAAASVLQVKAQRTLAAKGPACVYTAGPGGAGVQVTLVHV